MLFDSDTLLLVEWIAAALGVINISLLIFRSVWNFPFGIAMVSLYIFVFFEKRLYAEAGLQVFFILAQAWGWWLWIKIGGEDNRVPVRWLDWLSRGVWIMVTAAVSVNLGWAMHSFTNAVLPYADAGIAGASVAAQILLAYRRIGALLLVVVEGVARPARIEPGARLLDRVAVGDAVEVDHAGSLRLKRWMRGSAQANRV